MQDKSVVIGQGQRIGGQFVQLWVVKAERRLDRPLPLLLMQEIGNVVGAESAGGMGLVHRGGHRFRPILSNQIE